MDKFDYDKLNIQDAWLVRPRSHKDFRGEFMELLNEEEFRDNGPALIFPHRFVQSNLSISKPGIIRGMHIQRRNPQGKLVFCLSGKILDVGVDLRPNSPTFQKVQWIELSSTDAGVYWPPGVAHGLYSYNRAAVLYYCTTPHDAESDGGVYPLDPALNIPWPDSAMLSGKDMNLPSLAEYLT